jgi:hypothetical protein
MWCPRRGSSVGQVESHGRGEIHREGDELVQKDVERKKRREEKAGHCEE